MWRFYSVDEFRRGGQRPRSVRAGAAAPGGARRASAGPDSWGSRLQPGFERSCCIFSRCRCFSWPHAAAEGAGDGGGGADDAGPSIAPRSARPSRHQQPRGGLRRMMMAMKAVVAVVVAVLLVMKEITTRLRLGGGG